MNTSKPSGLNPYLETRIRTAGPLELTSIMYDVLVASLERAVAATEAGWIEERTESVNRALLTLAELRCSLDHDNGGAIAVSLERLYAYASTRLTEAAVRRDAAAVRGLIDLFAPLREAWRSIAADAAGTGASDRGALAEPMMAEAVP